MILVINLPRPLTTTVVEQKTANSCNGTEQSQLYKSHTMTEAYI